MEDFETINPFTLAPWIGRVETITDDGERSAGLRPAKMELYGSLSAAPHKTTWLAWGCVVETPMLAQEGPRLERFSFTLGTRAGQNPFMENWQLQLMR
jgi:hypothetical protein